MSPVRARPKLRDPVSFLVEGLHELEEGLRINKTALDDELQMQPELFYAVSKRAALAVSIRDGAKQTLQETESRINLAVRLAAEKDGEKLTEREVEARVRLHSKVQAAQDALLAANHEVAMLSALKDAFQQRSYVLKDLANLWVANYYGDASAGRASDDIKTKDAAYVKREAAKIRRSQR